MVEVADTADVVVIGGGAAGMMAALQAGLRGLRTVLLEKNRQPGLKIRISGGGRCNLTTTKTGRALEAEYGDRRGRWLRHGLRAFQPKELMALIEGAGVPLREEDLDKIFPVSGKAQDVVDAMLRLLGGAGVSLVREAAVAGIERLGAETGEGAPSGEAARFAVHSARGTCRARSVVLATGGLSYPKTGATGDGYPWVQAVGHTLVRPVPHLAPLPMAQEWVHSLAGIVLNESSLGVAERGADGRREKDLCRRSRPILFTHKGLSGPAAMDLAGFVEERRDPDGDGRPCEVRFDFVPEARLEDLERELVGAAAGAGKKHAASLLPRKLPERLRNALVEQAGAGGPVAELKKDARRRLVHSLKHLALPVERSMGFAHAEVTRGGVALDEVDGRTMESKLCPGLFLCGEILDIDGPIGGFNFQAAFATGRLAGLAC